MSPETISLDEYARDPATPRRHWRVATNNGTAIFACVAWTHEGQAGFVAFPRDSVPSKMPNPWQHAVTEEKAVRWSAYCCGCVPAQPDLEGYVITVIEPEESKT